MNRRQFLTATAASGMLSCLPESAAATRVTTIAPRLKPPLIGSQLYGWGQYYEREGRDLSAHLDEVLSALRDAGYDYAEGSLDVAHPSHNARFAERLKKKGLRPVSLYSGGAFHVLGKASETAERIAVAAREAAKSGFAILNVNPDPIGRDKTDAELIIQAEALVELGEALRTLGMKLGIHHHTPELANGAKEFHSNFTHCPRDLVGFCYDVHWVYRGGIAPAECLPRYGDRVVSWHLRQSRDQIWWEDLDTGDLDYAAVASFVRANRLPAFYTVELAIEPGTRITRSVVANHARSRDFVKQTLGV
ncbi:MAG: sugar phosphate isomerase/epimerase [Verrucomicrobia bacterium]|nr:sugar phosphate isomerase/epimerase [Verrucomicrobiota bacterium]